MEQQALQQRLYCPCEAKSPARTNRQSDGQPGQGCPIATLGCEIARAGDAVRQACDQGVEALRTRLADGSFCGVDNANERALSLLATLAGTIMSARAAKDGSLRRSVLRAGTEAVRLQLAGN